MRGLLFKNKIIIIKYNIISYYQEYIYTINNIRYNCYFEIIKKTILHRCLIKNYHKLFNYIIKSKTDLNPIKLTQLTRKHLV
jgi:hypothetical protein